jgi:hypothetical protein
MRTSHRSSGIATSTDDALQARAPSHQNRRTPSRAPSFGVRRSFLAMFRVVPLRLVSVARSRRDLRLDRSGSSRERVQSCAIQGFSGRRPGESDMRRIAPRTVRTLLRRRTEQERKAPAGVGGDVRPETGETFLPARERRPSAESVFVRVVATGGIVGLGTAAGAAMAAQDVAGWVIGLSISLGTVVLAAVLWSSRRL